MRVLFILVLAVTLSSCGTQGAPQPPSLNIPQPVKDLHAVRKGDNVRLFWTAPKETTDGALVRKPGKMVVRRATGDSQPPTVVAEVPLKPADKSQQAQSVSAKDSLGDLLRSSSADFALYTVEAVSASGKSAGQSNPVAVPLVPAPPTPKDLQVKVVPEGVSISWAQNWPPQNRTKLAVQYVYRIMRREQVSKQPVMVKQLSAGNADAMVIDTTIEWEKTYQYWVTPVALWQDSQRGEVEGDDSDPVSITAHDVFPPQVPSGLQAVFSLVGGKSFIDLTWTPNTDPDLAGYNVYRHMAGTQPTKINAELIKIPAFRDADLQTGTKYFYSVSAVDLRNNESGKSQEASETVPKQ
jgi:hypothetical protein